MGDSGSKRCSSANAPRQAVDRCLSPKFGTLQHANRTNQDRRKEEEGRKEGRKEEEEEGRKEDDNQKEGEQSEPALLLLFSPPLCVPTCPSSPRHSPLLPCLHRHLSPQGGAMSAGNFNPLGGGALTAAAVSSTGGGCAAAGWSLRRAAMVSGGRAGGRDTLPGPRRRAEVSRAGR
mgnify:CR=1 FL=1